MRLITQRNSGHGSLPRPKLTRGLSQTGQASLRRHFVKCGLIAGDRAAAETTTLRQAGSSRGLFARGCNALVTQ
jgi:hypothetical protein